MTWMQFIRKRMGQLVDFAVFLDHEAPEDADGNEHEATEKQWEKRFRWFIKED